MGLGQSGEPFKRIDSSVSSRRGSQRDSGCEKDLRVIAGFEDSEDHMRRNVCGL